MRSEYKGPYVDHKLYQEVEEKLKLQDKNNTKSQKIVIKTNCRSSTIIPKFVGIIFHVHNGKKYKEIEIYDSMLGRKLGEFVFTRTPGEHKCKKRK